MKIDKNNNTIITLKSLMFPSLLSLVTFFMFSCNESPSKKINSENVKATEDRVDKAYDSSEIQFDFDSYDFGEVRDGEIVEVDFNFTNTGKSDLIIYDAEDGGVFLPGVP